MLRAGDSPDTVAVLGQSIDNINILFAVIVDIFHLSF